MTCKKRLDSFTLLEHDQEVRMLINAFISQYLRYSAAILVGAFFLYSVHAKRPAVNPAMPRTLEPTT
jgi:hypothetical protein